VGLITQGALAFAEIVLLVRCARSPDDVERLPEARFETVLDALIPVLELWPFEASAGAKLSRAFEQLGGVARKV
jgi:hypothetical protein